MNVSRHATTYRGFLRYCTIKQELWTSLGTLKCLIVNLRISVRLAVLKSNKYSPRGYQAVVNVTKRCQSLITILRQHLKSWLLLNALDPVNSLSGVTQNGMCKGRPPLSQNLNDHHLISQVAMLIFRTVLQDLKLRPSPKLIRSPESNGEASEDAPVTVTTDPAADNELAVDLGHVKLT
jgi:hypothetical protein